MQQENSFLGNGMSRERHLLNAT